MQARRSLVALCLLTLVPVSRASAAPLTVVTPQVGGLLTAFRAQGSDDGARVLIRGWTRVGGNPGLWSVDVASGSSARITPEAQFVGVFGQSPDGSLVAWASGVTDERTRFHALDVTAGASPRSFSFPRRFANPNLAAVTVAASGRITVLADGGNAMVSATDAAVLAAAPGSSKLEPVPDPIVRQVQPGRQVNQTVVSDDGQGIGICRGFGADRVAISAMDASTATRMSSASGHGDYESCLVSDNGVGAMSVHARRASRYRLLVTSARPGAAVSIGRYGFLLGISRDGARVLATDRRGSRVAVIDLQRRSLRVLVRPTSVQGLNSGLRPGNPVMWSAAGDRVALNLFPRSGDATRLQSWLLDLGSGRWTRLPGTSDSANECFTPSGRVVVSLPDPKVADTNELYVSDAAGTRFTRVSDALKPFYAASDCNGAGPDRRIFLVAGSPAALYSVAEASLDDSPLAPAH